MNWITIVNRQLAMGVVNSCMIIFVMIYMKYS